jgi:putative hydrolase of the HAD superfamily
VDLPDPASVRTLLLDAGGVLVRPDFERVARTLGRHGVEVDAATLREAEPRVKKEIDRPPGSGTATDEQRGFVYFDLLLRRVGVTPGAATGAALAELKEWHDRHCLWDEVPAGVGPALRRLREAGLRLGVVSNSNGTVRRLMERLGFLELFDEVLDSAVEGVEKPDPRIFRRALERLAASAEESLFVGDLYNVDVVGGRRAGLRVVLVDEAGLYEGADCPRVGSLAELAAHLAHGVGNGAVFC